MNEVYASLEMNITGYMTWLFIDKNSAFRQIGEFYKIKDPSSKISEMTFN